TTKPWRYAYNALGELLGTSDARGCGQNFHYDSVGRLVAEDYSPCETHHTVYSPATGLGDPDTVSGVEVYYLYDSEAGGPVPAGCSSSFTNGRTVAVFDKASVTKSVYDARGRVTASCLRVAEPESTNEPDLDLRYAARTYRKNMSYDAADREIAATTGLADENFVEEEEDLLGSDGLSQIVTSYSARGTVKTVGGSYGPLITNIQRTADGLMQQMTCGDAAGT